ncbi:hypothetical protein N566_19430 [Streptomycetaceae bacterium MP113-05]|nr:hypothetical protein N566_19430 [Streptomycetaceae bacterium MP113-05]
MNRQREHLHRIDYLSSRDQGTAVLTALAAFWLFIAAWAIGYDATESGGDAYLNESVVGVLLLFLALSRFLRPLRQVFASVGVLLLGAWLIVSPFIWGYGEPPFEAAGAPQVEWATGAVVLILGALSLFWARTARRSGFRPR